MFGLEHRLVKGQVALAEQDMQIMILPHQESVCVCISMKQMLVDTCYLIATHVKQNYRAYNCT